jgi:hypothetical protein
MQRFSFLFIGGLIAAAAPRADAQRPQGKDSTQRQHVPAEARPPKGMCRVWIDGVPAAQQPAATDCPSAIKNRPNNARVIFGDDPADSSKKKAGDKGKMPPSIKGFSGGKGPAAPAPKRPPPRD